MSLRGFLHGCMAVTLGVAALCVQAQPAPGEAPEGASVPIAGEVLDTAIAQCEAGNQQGALALFAAIRSQLEPPPALLRLIERYEATGCTATPPRTSALTVQLGTGYDSNATQGVTARSLVVGSGPDAVELTLDDRYRPRASSFAQGTLDYRLRMDGANTTQFSINHRANVQTPDYDLTTVAAAWRHVLSDFGQRASVQGEWAESWLGGAHYQRAFTGGLRWIEPVSDGAWVYGATGSRLYYLTQPSQDAMQGELSVLREWKVGLVSALTGGGGLFYDHALGARPGGDRRGFQFQLGAQFVQAGWTIRPFASFSRWQSRDVFSEGLIDQRRLNRLGQLALELERPVSASSRIVVQWRDRDSRDNIALYRYRSQVLSVYWRWDRL